jgi:hypothetical protein
MSDDIVTRLRRDCMSLIADEAADEIERLRKEAFHLAANQCHSGYAGEYGHHRCSEIDRLTAERDEARREIERLRQERDEARREACHAEVDGYDSAENIAKERGWDCFPEVTP